MILNTHVKSSNACFFSIILYPRAVIYWCTLPGAPAVLAVRATLGGLVCPSLATAVTLIEYSVPD